MIDSYGTGNKAFWRGVLEGGGYMGLLVTQNSNTSPRIEIKATPAVLRKFIAFIAEANAERCGMDWAWDADGKLAWQANGGFIRVTGVKAQEVCLALYMGQSVGCSSYRAIADRIFQWISKR